MKLTTFLIFVSLGCAFASKTYSQSKLLSLNLEGTTVKEALSQIEDQSEFYFMYSSKLIDVDREVSLNLKDKKIDKVLSKLFVGTNVNYVVKDRFIVLTTEEVDGNIVSAIQQKTISGKVTDEEGQSLPGVNILVKGTSIGSVSDVEGNYSLEVPDEESVLVFSSVGYIREEIAVGTKSIIDVSLVPDITALEEIVVIGYGTMKKSDLTGAAVRADLESFQDMPNTNLLQSLIGSVPGLNVGQIDEAGEEPSIEIRGRSTLGGNRSVLIVVDGAIYRGSLTDLNPEDIESVDILKDASSKAIYGAQAANGVIIITSKTGKKGKPIIRYKSSYTYQTPSNDLRPMNREEMITSARDRHWRDAYLAPDYQQINPAWDLEDGYDFSVAKIKEGFDAGTDYQWFEEMTSPGFINDQQLSYSGGSENTNYFLSAGYTKQENWVLNDQFDRKTVRINFDTQVTPWLKIGANTYGSFSDYSGESPDIGTLASMTPFVDPYEENGDWDINPTGGGLFVNGFLMAQSKDIDKRYNITGNFYGVINIPKVEGLTYRVNYSHNYRWQNHFNSNLYGANGTGAASKDFRSTYDWTLDHIVDYKKQFNNHSFAVTLVAGQNEIEFDRGNMDGTKLSDTDLGHHSLPQAEIRLMTSEGWDEAFLYQTARINYDYEDKYLLTATLRRDGYSGFAKNEKTAYFPSVGLGWVATEDLGFLQESTPIDYLKLRASYGATGNLTKRYESLAQVDMDPDLQYIFEDGGSTINGQVPASLSNPNLTWEITKGLNFGLDFGLFNQRVNGSVEFYNSTTTDLLWTQVLPRVTGFSGIKTNLGKIANSGLEVQLNSNVIKESDFSWDVGINFSTNKNEIKELLGYDSDGDGKEDDLVASGLFIGKSIGAIYDYEVNGVWQISEEGELPDGFKVGTYKITDVNEDGKYTSADRKIIGKEEPAYRFGIQNTMKYKNFSLMFFINSVQGGKNGYLKSERFSNQAYVTVDFAGFNFFSETDYWSPRNPDAKLMGLAVSNPLPAKVYYSRSFVRLADISLSYDFNTSVSWVQRIGVRRLKLFVSAKNLLTLTDWPGWDPETGTGPNTVAHPVMKSVNAGFEINF